MQKQKKHFTIIGQPDIYIEPRICVFCDGDYWHNYPKGNKRDKIVNIKLKKQGYKVLRFWEHEIKNSVYECVKIIESVI